MTLKGALGHDFSKILEALRRSPLSDPVVYFPNVGNAGDAFIAAATYRFFYRSGVPFVLGTENAQYDGRVVLFAGGGNLTGPNSYGARIISRHAGRAARFILLPHTVNMYADLFADMGPNCTLFAREARTFDFLRRSGSRAVIEFSHDMAFSLTSEDIEDLSSPLQFAKNYLPEMVLDYRIREIAKIAFVAYCRAGHLMALRNDVEKTDRIIPRVNIDISKRLWPSSLVEKESDFVARLFIYSLKLARSVRTNRLHVGIGSALLGKRTFLHDNSYGKNRDVFEASFGPAKSAVFCGV